MTRLLDQVVTMEPVVRTGRAAWDQRVLPRDEFAARLRSALEVSQRAGADALLVIGHAARSECLTYLTNFVPSARCGALVAVPGHEPVLLAGLGGRREEPYQRTVAWVRDLVHAPLTGATLRQVLADRGRESGRLGVVGLAGLMPAASSRAITAGLGTWEMVALDGEMAGVWRRAGARERAVLAQCSEVLAQAQQQAIRAFRGHGSATRSAATAERAARLAGCRDIRILIGAEDGSLRPYQGVHDDRPDVLVAYLAAEWLGYWGELAFTYPWTSLPPAADLRPALTEVRRLVRPGERPERLRESFADGELHVRGVGLSFTELPDPAWRGEGLRDGDIISLLAAGEAGPRLTLASSTVAAGADGGTPLQAWRP